MVTLDDVDLSAELSKKEGKRRLKAAQKRLLELRLQLGGQLGDGELGPPLCVVPLAFSNKISLESLRTRTSAASAADALSA